ncbi:septum site-determining protein Ssd [Streptomyces litchfieldiae]|uniref:Septum formation initiator n=1 Tax=Streptomyces litchfieldiae TaxID=3075543 RepID=A0ABU2MJV2_9ACTN|nr:septum site-determining protein Ssd [Streptomyces sp. DSM 44938]MDT0341886.1 septum formation initiator [Streptomyces sp. DSM 44938]
MPESILILTEDEDLLDDLLRLCAAAGAEAEVVHGAPVAPGQWERAPLVMVGDDRAAALSETGRWPGRRPGVLLVGRDLDDHTVWARGVGLGAEQVLHLPGDEPWLADRIADAVERPGPPALTLGVLGGRGGAGASSLACALAVTAAAQGLRTTLIDADPLGGGLDVLLGAERTPGPRWPAFVSARGRLSGTALDESLPRPRGVGLLSWDRADGARLPAEAMCTVLTAARRGGGVVVVDLPRAADEAAAEALAQLDMGLLVVPGELRAVAGAQRVIATSGALVRDLRVVARPLAAGGLAGSELARLLGLPLAGELPDEPGLSAAADLGEPPGGNARGVLAKFCGELLARALPAAGAAV